MGAGAVALGISFVIRDLLRRRLPPGACRGRPGDADSRLGRVSLGHQPPIHREVLCPHGRDSRQPPPLRSARLSPLRSQRAEGVRRPGLHLHLRRLRSDVRPHGRRARLHSGAELPPAPPHGHPDPAPSSARLRSHPGRGREVRARPDRRDLRAAEAYRSPVSKAGRRSASSTGRGASSFRRASPRRSRACSSTTAWAFSFQSPASAGRTPSARSRLRR